MIGAAFSLSLKKSYSGKTFSILPGVINTVKRIHREWNRPQPMAPMAIKEPLPGSFRPQNVSSANEISGRSGTRNAVSNMGI